MMVVMEKYVNVNTFCFALKTFYIIKDLINSNTHQGLFIAFANLIDYFQQKKKKKITSFVRFMAFLLDI